MEVGRPVALLMDILHELRQHCDAHSIPIDASARVPALDELMAMLAIIYFRKVVLETSEAAQSKLEQYQQLQEQIGWSDAQLATCTGPEARAMLLYLHQVSSAGEKRLNVTVRRSSAFWDAFESARKDGLLPSPAGAMCHKYFPSFVDEFTESQARADAGSAGRKPAVEAGEGHGPRKEFFELAGLDMAGQQPTQPLAAGSSRFSTPDVPVESEAATAPGAGTGSSSSSSKPRRPALWVFNRTAGAFWYNTQLQETPELKGAYAFAGWLLGQSLLNRAPLGLRLPPVLFQALLEGAPGSDGAGGFQPTLEVLADFDPDAAASVRNAAALPQDQLAAVLELDGLPSTWTSEQYVRHSVAQILRDGVAWQSAALAAGFFAALDRRLLRAWQLGPAALAALVAGGGATGGAGDAPADLSSLFRLVLDEELSGPSSILVELLWEVLANWPAERRLRFVEFVTGTSRLPLPGSELLKIQAPFVAMGASEHKATLGMLPQAHTCDNLLELPNYWESLLAVRGVRGGPAAIARGTTTVTDGQLAELRAEARRILDDRLEIAVSNFQGYGLDERSGPDDDDYGEGPDGRKLNPPELSPEPEVPLTPAALTADSLASLARFSAASSSMLHSSHPLAFSAAVAAAAAASQPLAQRGNRMPPLPVAHDAATAATAGVSVCVPVAPHSPVPSRQPLLSASGAPQRLALGSESLPPPPVPHVLTDAERQANILARFEVDLNDRSRLSGGGAPYQAPAVKRESTSEGSNDAFK
ncbi:hypothetical protein GPECTOR_7g1135 [Gonium pectorale]|uniref:HECT-type E3 ubiquitin transferase n=1 Tax=Gonium pectorale TaxID=33097 RepID=A0A150GTT8_GONPE|nr:hypothetical protein GPECTOR_7g1135 [Gonium pectorale]|eukprot:KXZ53241.1 hypothetical protein GPECTOR_7g1135 [Gonium pectorale]